MLPQAPEEAGYCVYGNVGGVPGTGHLAQYAHPNMLSVIFSVEREWQAIADRKFGIGNISVANGLKYDHHTHMKGIEMDIRPVREDKMIGQAARCSRPRGHDQTGSPVSGPPDGKAHLPLPETVFLSARINHRSSCSPVIRDRSCSRLAARQLSPVAPRAVAG
jgi:hypothetical protein